MEDTTQRKSIGGEKVVHVKIKGPITLATGEYIEIEYSRNMTVEDISRILLERYGGKALEKGVYPALRDLFSQNLIIINGVEISALEGQETKLREGDEIIIINYTHGG